MPIPERFRRRPSAAEVKEFTALCHEIEEGVRAGEDVSDKLERWNRRCGRAYAPAEFERYYGAVSIETFVKEALLGRAEWVDDLTYAELEAVMAAVCGESLSEAELGFYLEWLDANLPGVSVLDLLDDPEQWFGYVPRLASPMTPRQLLAYAMHAAGRTFPDAPQDVTLPVPHPNTPEGEEARRAAKREEAWAIARDWAKAWVERSWGGAANLRARLGAVLEALPEDDLPGLRALIGRHGAACLQGMRELGLVEAAANGDAAKGEAPAKGEAAKDEAVRGESTKGEASKGEAAKGGAAKGEASTKSEVTKGEAAALDPSPAPAEGDEGAARVERVRHPKFGVGVVKAREGRGDDAKLEVAFEGGVRRLLARFVTPVDA